MGRADRYLGLQRMVTHGDVIYIYQPPTSSVAPPAARTEAQAEAQALDPAATAAVETGTEAGGEAGTGGEYWDWNAGTYTPAPPGYGYEFGSMRLVPVRPDRDAPE